MTKNNSAARRQWRASRIPLSVSHTKELQRQIDQMSSLVVDTLPLGAGDYTLLPYPLAPAEQQQRAAYFHTIRQHRLHMRMTADYKPGTYAGDLTDQTPIDKDERLLRALGF